MSDVLKSVVQATARLKINWYSICFTACKAGAPVKEHVFERTAYF